MKRFWHNFVQQDEYNTIRYEGRYIISISRLKMPSFVFFATDYQSAIRSFCSKCKWKDFDTSFVQQDEYNIWCNKIWRNVHYQDITFENASFCCFATDLKTSVFNTMNTVYDTIRHEGRYIISISRLKMPSFVLFFCNWLPICHLKDPFEASKWKSLETRFVQYDEYYTIDMIWWYMKNLSHLVERSIISVSL